MAVGDNEVLGGGGGAVKLKSTPSAIRRIVLSSTVS